MRAGKFGDSPSFGKRGEPFLMIRHAGAGQEVQLFHLLAKRGVFSDSRDEIRKREAIGAASAHEVLGGLRQEPLLVQAVEFHRFFTDRSRLCHQIRVLIKGE